MIKDVCMQINSLSITSICKKKDTKIEQIHQNAIHSLILINYWISYLKYDFANSGSLIICNDIFLKN